MSIVAEIVLTYIPPKRKKTPSGWISFNAPCCQHNGQSVDTRQRGGVIQEGDNVSYHCFNCGFKASWQPGRQVSHKLRKLLQWMNAPDDVINKLALTVMQENEGIQIKKSIVELPKFNTVPLPDDAVKIANIVEFNKHSMAVLEYMSARNLNLDDTDYYWSPSLGYRDRLIIPFYYEKRIVGWTARTIQSDKQPKYMSEQQPGFVYGLDEQGPNKVFTIVCEGPLDAIHIDGIALLGSEIKDQQVMLINRLNKDVVVVPDRDEAGAKLIEEAIDLGWGVSMPDWGDDINDIGEAVNKHGRLYALHKIVSAAETSPLKIRLKEKKWFNT
mgnify:FL=1|jgi:hypothetical protein|tara:strand:- start:716 stop:1699 length:984 start_codon:yes stop_codon:yes gene_type:complete